MGKHTLRSDARGLRNRIWFVVNIVFTCIYLIWRAFFTIPFEFGVVSVVAGLALFLVEFFGMLEALVHYFNMYNVEAHPVPEIPAGLYPDVDVFIATYNEPEEILYKTVNGCRHMKYPDKNKVHIFLCDDGHRDSVRALAERMGVGYIDRGDNRNAKAGNLNHAMSVTSSPYIVTFDADMIPRSEFLLRTVPYFIAQEMENEGKEEKDQKHIGFVQSPQSFYNPDLFQFNLYSEGRIPNEQDYFYRDIQVARNRSNSVIYGGSNTVISRRALEDIGGFFAETITEDYGTGILIQKKGYVCYATNEVLASGLSPTDLKSLITQRIRWARGVISTNRKLHIFLSKDLSFAQKCNYWASEWYWYAPLKRLIYFMSPILFATFGYMVIKCTLWQVLIFWLPMYVTSNISLRMLSRNIRTTKWTSIYETVLFPYLFIPVLMETFGITMKTFKVTKKGQTENEAGKNLLYLTPFALLVVLSVIGIFNCLFMIFDSNNMGPSVVLFWLIVNLFTLVMAMFFVLGRNYLRQSERTSAVMDCTICTPTSSYTGKTLDLSETGAAVRLDDPVSIDTEEDVTLELHDGRYKAVLKARIVHVDNNKDSWKYAFRITDYTDTYDEYLQLLFDRIPTLPQSLDSASGGFDDLRINVSRRAAKPFYQNRRLPRVPMYVQLHDTEGCVHLLTDFNYQYCTCLSGTAAPESMVLVISKKYDLVLDCERVRTLSPEKTLYLVKNYSELYSDHSKKSLLEAWVKNEWQYTRKNPSAAQNQLSVKEPVEEPEYFDEMKCV